MRRLSAFALIALFSSSPARAQDGDPVEEEPVVEAPVTEAPITEEPIPEAPVTETSDLPEPAPAETVPQVTVSPAPTAEPVVYVSPPRPTAYAIGPSSEPREPPAARRAWFGAFEARFGGSMGFAQLDQGYGVARSLDYGGFIGMDFAQPLSTIGDVGTVFMAMTWNAIDLRVTETDGTVAGGTDAGIGAGARFDLGPDIYFQVWIGYLFAGDTQTVYPDAGDLLAMWHLAYARSRFRLGPLALELGGGAGMGQHVMVGLRLQIVDALWLGGDLNGYFAGREDHPTRWGREQWITRAFLALRWE